MKIHEYNKEEHMGCCIDKAYKMVTGTISNLYEMTEDDCGLNGDEIDILKDAVETLAYLQTLSTAVEEAEEHHHHD